LLTAQGVNCRGPESNRHDPYPGQLLDQPDNVALDVIRLGAVFRGKGLCDSGQRRLAIQPVPDIFARVIQGEELVLHVANPGNKGYDNQLALNLSSNDVIRRDVYLV